MGGRGIFNIGNRLKFTTALSQEAPTTTAMMNCYAMTYWRPTTELLSPTAVMSEGLGFNLCVAPFLNVCVLNLPQRVGSRECQRGSELGRRCHTRVGQRETKGDCSEDEG